MSKKYYLIIFLLVVLMTGLWFFIYPKYFNKNINKFEGKIFNDFKYKGEIEKITNDSINIKIDYSNPVDGEQFISKTIYFDSNTEFFVKSDEIKEENRFKEEFYNYQELISQAQNLNKDASALEAPSWFIEKLIDFKNLKIGDNINCYCLNEYENKIKAKKIVVDNKKNTNLKEVFEPMEKKQIDLNGIITDIKENLIIFKPTDIIASSSQNTTTAFKILVNHSTKINTNIKKADEEFNKETKIYYEELKKQEDNLSISITPPEWFIKEPAKLNDFLNRNVKVTVSGDELNDNMEAISIDYYVVD